MKDGIKNHLIVIQINLFVVFVLILMNLYYIQLVKIKQLKFGIIKMESYLKSKKLN